MNWIVYLLIFCFAYAFGFDAGRNHAHVEVVTKQQLQMVLSRLGKDSIMILTGDRYQVDLKFTNDSAVHEVPKLTKSKWVNEIILLDNHRHEALDEILRLLNERY